MSMGLAGIARGLKQGFEGAGQAARQMEEDERKKTADERDKKRFVWEEARAGDEDRIRKAGEEFDNEMASIGQFVASGGATPAAQPERTAGITPPAQAAPAQGAAAPMGLSVTPNSQAAQPEPAKPANPFMIGTEGKPNERQLYDQMMARQEAALAKYYTKTRQIDKLQDLPERMEKIRENKYVEKTKTALAAMSEGAPGAVDVLTKVYSWINDGYSLAPNSGEKFDPKTRQWTGLVRVNDKTGEKETFGLTRGQLMSMAGKITAAELIKYEDSRSDKEIEQGFEGRKVAASELSASASMLKAKTGQDETDILRRSKIDQARVGAVNDMIQNTYKPPQKLDDMTVMQARGGDKAAQQKVKAYEDQNALYESRQGEIQTLRDRATSLLSLNPKLTASEAVAISRGGSRLQLQQDDNGTYVTYGGKKVYVN